VIYQGYGAGKPAGGINHPYLPPIFDCRQAFFLIQGNPLER